MRSKLTIVTLVRKNKGYFLDRFLWQTNRYASTNKVLIVMCPGHSGDDPEHLRNKYKNLDIQYHYTQTTDPDLEDLPGIVGAEADFNKAIYLDLEKPQF
jgi:hypothetical protein